MKENANNPKLVESICVSGKSDQVGPCVEGISHHGSLEPARTLCDQLEISNRKACHESLQSNTKLFGA